MKQAKKTSKTRDPKSIFITGASSGIGRALALAYAEQGKTLFLCGRNEGRLARVADSCRKKGAKVQTYIFDVNDTGVTAGALDDANRQRPLDLVIANAGVSGGSLGAKENALSTQAILQTNIWGVVNTVLPTIELMRRNKKGQIALMSSMAGYRGLPSCPAYSASKCCVKAWGEALRGFLKQEDIDVNVICPGFIATPLTDANTFKMPFLMDSERAAHIIKKGLSQNKPIIAFPSIMAFGSWLVSALPSFLSHPILNRLPRKEQ